MVVFGQHVLDTFRFKKLLELVLRIPVRIPFTGAEFGTVVRDDLPDLSDSFEFTDDRFKEFDHMISASLREFSDRE